jgi:hypothetical protein
MSLINTSLINTSLINTSLYDAINIDGIELCDTSLLTIIPVEFLTILNSFPDKGGSMDTLPHQLIRSCFEIYRLLSELDTRKHEQLDQLQDLISDIHTECIFLTKQTRTLSNGQLQTLSNYANMHDLCDCKDYVNCVICSLRICGFDNASRQKRFTRSINLEAVIIFSNTLVSCGMSVLKIINQLIL